MEKKRTGIRSRHRSHELTDGEKMYLRIKEFCNEKNITLNFFSENIGMTRQNLYAMCKSDGVKSKHLRRIYDVYKLKLIYI